MIAQSQLLLAFIVLATSQNCPTFYHLGESSCTFHIEYTDSSCNDFTFIQCAWDECSNTDSQNGISPHCDRFHPHTDSDWNRCTRRCCDSSMIYYENAESMNKCQDYLGTKAQMGVVMGVGIGLSVLVLATTLCCFYWCSRDPKSCDKAKIKEAFLYILTCGCCKKGSSE
jgi:hypothetical protein